MFPAATAPGKESPLLALRAHWMAVPGLLSLVLAVVGQSGEEAGKPWVRTQATPTLPPTNKAAPQAQVCYLQTEEIGLLDP